MKEKEKHNICQQQTCSKRNAKRSLSHKREIIPEGNLETPE